LKRLGYLCSEFPALSHTFISREIAILEREGFKIVTASINPTKDIEKLSEEDKIRARETYCVKRTPKLKMLGLFVSYALRPRRFTVALAFSLKLAWLGGPRSLIKALGYFFQAILLHAWAKSNDLSHVHIHFPNPAATVALVATRFGDFAFSLTVHGSDEFYEVERYILREKFRAAAFVRCIGYYCRSQVMRLTPTEQWPKLHVIRCGLFQDEFSPRPERAALPKEILCVGRLCPSKGQALLIDVAEILEAKGLDFQIVLLGGGEDLDMIKRIVAERGLERRVTVAGAVSHQRIKEELEKADLFVLPSFAEGIPIALMEAMAAGVPVVSTAITGIPELIDDGEEGVLVQASNVEQLSSVIEAFLRDQLDARRLVEKAIAKIKSQYDVEKNTRQLGALFEALGDEK
jgi:colanic acid/amylovoran biosynthesis glycosyltransferase